MATSKVHPSSWTETLAGLFILLALAALAVGLYRRQFEFNPALRANTPAATPLPTTTAPAVAEPADSTWTEFMTDDLAPMSSAETFDAENLSDKIDGKADLYLTSGFVRLQCRRFARTGDPDSWIEVFAYDMGNVRQAFAVHSGQRREQSKDLDLGSFAYRTADALFFVHGKYYVEIVGSKATRELADDMEAFARRFAARTATEEESIPELALLPRANRIEGSVILYLSNGFGYDGFSSLFAANYWTDGVEQTAFFAVRGTDAGSANLASAYAEFLLANGGEEQSTLIAVPGARVVSLFGTYEVFFTHAGVLAGVHQAENREAAEKLAVALYEEMSKDES
jgi:hypothetical protein